MLFVRAPLCNRGAFTDTFRRTAPRLLCTDQRWAPSARPRRVPPTGPVHPTPFLPVSTFASVLLGTARRGLHAPAGRARTTGSAEPASPTPDGSLKAPPGQASTVPLQDVRRILQLAQSERWSLSGEV